MPLVIVALDPISKADMSGIGRNFLSVLAADEAEFTDMTVLCEGDCAADNFFCSV